MSQKVCGLYPRNGHRPLKSHKDSGASTLVSLPLGHVLTIKSDGPLRDHVVGMSRDRQSERAFPRAVRAHHRMGFAKLHF